MCTTLVLRGFVCYFTFLFAVFDWPYHMGGRWCVWFYAATDRIGVRVSRVHMMPHDFITPVEESAVTPLKWRMYMDMSA